MRGIQIFFLRFSGIFLRSTERVARAYVPARNPFGVKNPRHEEFFASIFGQILEARLARCAPVRPGAQRGQLG